MKKTQIGLFTGWVGSSIGELGLEHLLFTSTRVYLKLELELENACWVRPASILTDSQTQRWVKLELVGQLELWFLIINNVSLFLLINIDFI